MSGPAHGHGHPTAGGLGPPRTVEVASGAFAYVQPDGSWWINNAGFLVGSDRVTAVDTASTERRTQAFRRAVAAVSPHPVTTLVNTHHHGDHTNGNCLFPEASIIGHVRCREVMVDQRIGGLDAIFGAVEWGDLKVAPPDVTFSQQLDLWVGERRVELRYIGTPAHTTGDVVVWLPEEKVLFAGDLLFNGGTPFALMGSIQGSLAALEAIRRLAPAVIVPGHGGVCGPEAIDTVEGYLSWLTGVARDAHRAGVSPLEAARATDLGAFGQWLDPERIVGNLHRAYAELDGLPLGSPIDLAMAFGDMIAYNGGGPLRCLA
ncbi:MAG TPA: MBL fold metallo-hydrolase [Acidimicrobiales bacterium]|nr:MBL fold metallo-hydrolase [Acidimicrobiales bacterium]